MADTIEANAPTNFLETVVRPNIAEFHANFSDVRRAYNAVSALDALAAHVYTWAKTKELLAVTKVGDDTQFRTELAKRDKNFALLRDIAKAQKHVRLNRGEPLVTDASQVHARPVCYSEGGYGSGRFSGPPQVVVEVDGVLLYVEAIVDQALSFLEAEISRFDAQNLEGLHGK
jgi:hypothetical protein